MATLPERIQTAQSLQEKRQLFFDDLLEFYVDHPERRAVDDRGNCQYDNGKGCHCAIGRWLIYDEDFPYGKAISYVTLAALYSQYIPEWLSDLGTDFLGDMQTIHDAYLDPKRLDNLEKNLNYIKTKRNLK